MTKTKRPFENLMWGLTGNLKSPSIQTLRGFAEREIVIPTGPYDGSRFRVSTQPFTGLLFDEIDSGRWNRIFISGPNQSSKTLCGFAIPLLREVYVNQQNVILGIPEADMADDKWSTDLRPVIAKSPNLVGLLPQKGSGSKGGKVHDAVDLANGVRVKIMTRGGQDTAKAGFTARYVGVTEAAGWSEASETSSEADPLRQLAARQRAWPRRERLMIVEGTMTTAEELPYRARGRDEDEHLLSTRSRLVTPCPHCEAWISPEREDFIGWENAKTETEAANGASFYCPACGEQLTEADRREANQDVKLLHHGQEVVDGEIVGEPPDVSTLWFRWSQWNNMLVPMSDHAIDEWEARQIEEDTEDRRNAEKALCQQVWCIPYEAESFDVTPLTREMVASRAVGMRRGEVPDDTVALSGACDIRGKEIHYAVIAWNQPGRGRVIDAGIVPVRSQSLGVRPAIMEGLRELRDKIIEPGYQTRSGQRFVCGWFPVDGGWKVEVVRAFVRETKAKGIRRYIVAFGRGQSQPRNKGSYQHPAKVNKTIQHIGDQYYVNWHAKHALHALFVNSDEWKSFVHEGLSAPLDTPGAIELFEPVTEDEQRLVKLICRQVTAEKAIEKVVTDRGPVMIWVNESHRPNHFLDVLYNACAAGHLCGVRIVNEQRPAPRPVQQRTERYEDYGEQMVLATER